MKSRAISMKRRAIVAVGATVGPIIAAVFAANAMVSDHRQNGGASRESDNSGAGADIHGLSASLTVHQLIERAEVVIVGTPTKHEIKAFREAVPANELPANERDGPIYLKGSFSRYTIDVAEVIKGDAKLSGNTADVRTYASTPGVSIAGSFHRELKVGQRYVFLLFRGQGVWRNAWLILGKDGLADVEGETAKFPSSARHSLDQLRDMARTPAPPDPNDVEQP